MGYKVRTVPSSWRTCENCGERTLKIVCESCGHSYYGGEPVTKDPAQGARHPGPYGGHEPPTFLGMWRTLLFGYTDKAGVRHKRGFTAVAHRYGVGRFTPPYMWRR